MTWALVPALESFQRWENDKNDAERSFASGEILTELVGPIRDAHKDLAEAYSRNDAENEASDPVPEATTADWACLQAIKSVRPLARLGRSLENVKFVDADGCPRLDDTAVAEDIAEAAAWHLRKLKGISPPSALAWEWLTVKATLTVFHVLADRLAIASHSTRPPEWKFTDCAIPEKEVLDALDVLITNADR